MWCAKVDSFCRVPCGIPESCFEFLFHFDLGFYTRMYLGQVALALLALTQ